MVCYANFLKFVERARSEGPRALGFEQDALRDAHGAMFVVRRVEVDSLSAACFNDTLEVSVSLKRIGGASRVAEQTVARDVISLVAAKVMLA